MGKIVIFTGKFMGFFSNKPVSLWREVPDVSFFTHKVTILEFRALHLHYLCCRLIKPD